MDFYSNSCVFFFVANLVGLFPVKNVRKTAKDIEFKWLSFEVVSSLIFFVTFNTANVFVTDTTITKKAFSTGLKIFSYTLLILLTKQTGIVIKKFEDFDENLKAVCHREPGIYRRNSGFIWLVFIAMLMFLHAFFSLDIDDTVRDDSNPIILLILQIVEMPMLFNVTAIHFILVELLIRMNDLKNAIKHSIKELHTKKFAEQEFTTIDQCRLLHSKIYKICEVMNKSYGIWFIYYYINAVFVMLSCFRKIRSTDTVDEDNAYTMVVISIAILIISILGQEVITMNMKIGEELSNINILSLPLAWQSQFKFFMNQINISPAQISAFGFAVVNKSFFTTFWSTVGMLFITIIQMEPQFDGKKVQPNQQP